MKYSNAAILGFLGCALALPTPAQDESQGLPNLPFPLPSGLALPSELPKISDLLPTGLPIKRDESGGLPFPLPSGISDLLNPSGGSGESSATATSSGSSGSGGLPIPSGISNLLHPSGQPGGSGSLPFPIPSGISDLLNPSGGSGGSGSSSGAGGLPDLTKLLPTDLPIKRDEEAGGLPFPIPSGISDLLNPSGGSGESGSSSGSGSGSGLGDLLPSGLPDISKLLPTELPIKRDEEAGRLPFHLLPSGFPNFPGFPKPTGLPDFPKPTGLFPEPPKPVGGEQPAPTPTSAAVPTGSAVAFKA
ncbi:extracellular proline-rich protein [Aspergillus melleus]|uniref:extracellular proline-rich protein n=1 Tax=Aspergillus melleus TaxID=138277 RepID=UPI001E8DE7EA|nr:uncharacterized protein LDX57_004592 [Aspergillus melleus]KAH8426865.1 hypothetical protein LDX57_004592 [Aspergillus melleus]